MAEDNYTLKEFIERQFTAMDKKLDGFLMLMTSLRKTSKPTKSALPRSIPS
jgi:hypothetical protein